MDNIVAIVTAGSCTGAAERPARPGCSPGFSVIFHSSSSSSFFGLGILRVPLGELIYFLFWHREETEDEDEFEFDYDWGPRFRQRPGRPLILKEKSWDTLSRNLSGLGTRRSKVCVLRYADFGTPPSMKNAKAIIRTLFRHCGKHWIGRKT
jgi:hypothetical protein